MSNYPPLGPKGASRGRPNPAGWDKVQIGNWILPGRARLTKGAIGLKYDPKPSAGKDGTRPTFHGVQPEEIDLEWAVWEQADLDKADEICQKIVPTTTLARNSTAAVDKLPVYVFDSPWSRNIGVTAVKILKGTIWTHASEFGVCGRKMTLTMLDWRYPPNNNVATRTPKGTPERTPKRKSDNPKPSEQAGTSAPVMPLQH